MRHPSIEENGMSRGMLVHIRPRIFCPGVAAELVEFHIEPFGLHLRGTDLATGRPYPNKGYKVGRRRMGRKAVDGILIETRERVDDLQCTARWAVNATYVTSHKVFYRVLDEDFDAVSDSMLLWHATSKPLGGWSSRWPKWAEGLYPASAEPIMEISPGKEGPQEHDVLNEYGLIVARQEVFAMPTIEPERITDCRMRDIPLPRIDAAFQL
jgi:hypothetical protein